MVTKQKFYSIIIMLVLLTTFIFFYSLGYYENSSENSLHFAQIITISVYIISFVVWYMCTGKLFSLYFIFFICCFLFNAGQILLGFFNVDSINIVGLVNIYHLYKGSALMKMLLFQSECVIAMTIGAIIAYKETEYTTNAQVSINNKTGQISTFEVLYIAVSILLIVSYMKELFTRSSSSYNDYYYGERQGVSIVLLFLYHTFMYKILLEHEKDIIEKFAWITNILLVTVMLMIGSRNAILQIVFGSIFLIVYIKKKTLYIKPHKIILYIIIGIILLLFLTGVQNLRKYSFTELNTNIIHEVYGIGIIDSISEALTQMGGSARCLIQTMLEIDGGSVSREPTIIYALAKGIININILSLFGFNEPVNFSLSAWITKVGGSQSGWGYSIFAEAYYDFGGLGWIFLAIWGFVYVKLEQFALRQIRNGNTLWACSLVYVLSYAIFLSRADMCLISSRIRYCLYLFIVLYLLKLFQIKSA